MNQSFYVAAVGARQQMQRMAVQANNIANVNTGGYKAERPAFAALMYRNFGGIGGAQLPKGTGGRMIAADTDFASGPMGTSPLPYSYAIEGDGFFALADIGTGEIFYTREGAFSLAQSSRSGEDGQPEEVFYLSDGEGRLVLSRTGTPIMVTDPDADQPVGVFDFVNRNGMIHRGGNRFQPADKNGDVRMGTGKVRRGMLEGSNTDLTHEITKVIEAQRSFSYALKMVQTSDEIETTINGLRG